MLTGHVGFVLDYLSELFHREMRRIARYGNLWEEWFELPAGQYSYRDIRSINRTFSGLTKLIFPGGTMEKEDARILLRLAVELRLRVRVQMHRINAQEFPLTTFSFHDQETGVEEVVSIEA